MSDRRRAAIKRAALLGLAPLLLLAGCHHREKPPSPAASVPVHVAAASTVSWPQTVTVPATVSAVDVAVLASRAGGWVTQVNTAAGDHVAQGQLLVAVGLPAAHDRVVAAEARLSSAKAGLAEASANEQRYSILVRRHAASQKQYDAIHHAFIAAKAQLAAAKSALAAATSNLGYAEIRAPFAGTVVEKQVWRGAFAAPGAPLLTIAGAKPEIRAHVGPAVYSALKTGETAAVDIGGATRTGTITRIVAGADPVTHTHLVELYLPQATAASYGSYAEVRLTLGHNQQLTVPVAALTRRAGLRGVFVVGKDDRAHFRLVRVGATHHGRTAVVAGLAPGEKVVVPPPANLVNDAPVRPEAAVSASSSTDTRRG